MISLMMDLAKRKTIPITYANSSAMTDGSMFAFYFSYYSYVWHSGTGSIIAMHGLI